MPYFGQFPSRLFFHLLHLFGISGWKQVTKLECGPMPNVMVALPNIGGTLVRCRKVWLTPTTRVPCSNAAKTRKPLKFAGVPQTRQQISAVSTPKFTRLRGHVEEVSMSNKFFPDCRYMSQLRRHNSTKLSDGAKMAIFCVL